ncbi:2-ketoisovalerate ferredoxin oxidoreductase [miscellaneous Crenarchaeota group-15 archaeon DG-45]|uniref:2-ketoisovalerate ferredoxin oxidoreductase n=1 Tax=miscellaneous Crenarchaeota group-15 archaeon DG-45 TaxID=1685127 RepID=A0A0M0BS30_9ARCH|nr:MAG: 2-ketoisovalerate ferredoxin oxidoreductase [miscellaneous Crenarchaeota group-15 archaeon DG-45]
MKVAERALLTGNEAIAEAAIQAGCRHFFGYPITPQSEIPEYMSRRMPDVGGVYLQAESEVAAINMVFGAAGAGARAMTSSSSPGISLMQEGISYLAAAELPCLIVNMMRGGPGLGGIQPSQSDYFQATKGGGHGDYRLLVLAPSTVQEAADLTMLSFDLADRYRNPVMVLGDGYIGQMMEPVRFVKPGAAELPSKDWAITGAEGRPRNVIRTLSLDPESLEAHNLHLHRKYEDMRKNELRVEMIGTDDAEIIIAAFGIVARIVKTAIRVLREKGIRVGLVRPITLFPFPYEALSEAAGRVENVLVVEMNMGQMVEDVKLGVCGRSEVHFYGRAGGMVPSYEEIVREVERIHGGGE